MEPPAKKPRLTTQHSKTFNKNRPLPSDKKRQRLLEGSQNTPEWTLWRKDSLGAAHSSCRCGHGNATIVDQFALDTGRIIWEPEAKVREMFAHGHTMEPKAADYYVNLTGAKGGELLDSAHELTGDGVETKVTWNKNALKGPAVGRKVWVQLFLERATLWAFDLRKVQ